MSTHHRLKERPSGDQAWQDLGYDIGWEASAGGIIRCLSVRNRRSDLFTAIEGLNLADIWCEGRKRNALALIQEGRLFRQMAVRLPRLSSAERFYLSASALPDGGSSGTLMALPPEQDEALRASAALLSRMSDARSREESYRHEAELMLKGLRTLMGEMTAAEKLDALARLMVDAVRGGVHLLLREGRDGTLKTITPGLKPPADSSAGAAWRDQSAAVAVYDDASPHIGRLRRLLCVESGEVAVTVLPFASEGIVLLCASEKRQKFKPDDIAFACRFALILRQAMVLKEEQDKLVQTAKLSILGQMSASLAHELRQPLNTIGMTVQNLELMAAKGAVTPDVLGAKLTRILGQVERASKIMERVRCFSRKGGEQFAEADLAALAHGVRMLSDHVLTANNVRLALDVPPGLTAFCDALQIEQVLTNLVRNSIDAITGKGSAQAASGGIIAIRARRTEQGVVLRVEDSGPGFPAWFLARPLETFFTTKDAETGTGLGLSICNTIAREHAGRLELGNHAKGAFVDLHLPERVS